jgi:hypothetical protein
MPRLGSMVSPVAFLVGAENDESVLRMTNLAALPSPGLISDLYDAARPRSRRGRAAYPTTQLTPIEATLTITRIQRLYAPDSPLAILLDLADVDGPSEDEQRRPDHRRPPLLESTFTTVRLRTRVTKGDGRVQPPRSP